MNGVACGAFLGDKAFDANNVRELLASRKIEAVIQMLSGRGQPILLINTAHNLLEDKKLTVAEILFGTVLVTEINLSTMRSSVLGKLRNLLQTRQIFDLAMSFGKPSLIWLYNGYAFESMFGFASAKHVRCPVVLEMEDWHFSRYRGINPKPLIDWWFCRRLLPQVAHAFAVNQQVAHRISNSVKSVSLFPGIVTEGVKSILSTSPAPFSRTNHPITIGYFGGLSLEKGADKLLSLAKSLSTRFKLVVTGAGPLREEFRACAAAHPDLLEFDGVVEESRLLYRLAQCDVVVNPHTPIDLMANGVFPFKVVEYVASGRLVISTKLPMDGLEPVLQGVQFVDYSIDALVDAIRSSSFTYNHNIKTIRAGAVEAARLFDAGGISSALDHLKC